jgi:hypothetical protein
LRKGAFIAEKNAGILFIRRFQDFRPCSLKPFFAFRFIPAVRDEFGFLPGKPHVFKESADIIGRI